MLTPLMVENLIVLRAAIQAHKANLFNLEAYTCKTPCGTLYCSAGLATTMPHFQNQGMHLDDSGDNVLVNGVGIANRKGIEINKLFGPDAFNNLFTWYGNSNYDVELLELPEYQVLEYDHDVVSHQQLALHRIDKQLDKYGAN